MSDEDRSLVSWYLEVVIPQDTTKDLLEKEACMRGRRLPPAGRAIRDGVRALLATRKAA